MKQAARVLSWLASVILAVVLAAGVFPASATTEVFINEIHYDNTGTDSGEAIEIAGPAGTDLTGWSIVLYNGSNGTVYDTEALDGLTIPDLGTGYGVVVVNFPSNGIQNGAPDGLVLADDTGTVVQFVSYEGTFAAIGGLADGMTSTDIGVTESGSGAVGNSLQLAGTGTTYEDFTWSEEATNTFGAANTGQSFESGGPTPTPTPVPTEPPPAPSIVINEIDYDQPSTDAAEFVEIKNAGEVDVDLAEVTLELVNGSNDSIYQSFSLPAVTLLPGDYFVVCGNAANVANCDLDVSPDTNLVQNGAPDAAGLRYNGVLIDAVSYEGNAGAPYTEGSGEGLEDVADEGMSISRCPDGTDTDQNNLDFTFTSSTPGVENACSVPPSIEDPLINEFVANHTGSDTNEFVEIYASPATDYTAYALLEIEGDSSGAGVIDGVFPVGGTDGAGYWFTGFLDNELENGTLTLLLVENFSGTAGSDLDSDNDGVFDATPWDRLVDAVSINDGGSGDQTYASNALDAFYDGMPFAPGGASRIPNGFDSDSVGDWVRNDFDGYGIPGFTGTQAIGEAVNTPGAENVVITVIVDMFGACQDPAFLIHDIQGAGLSSPEIGNIRVVEGIVVGDFDGAGELSGFNVQEENADVDADPATSEGIFVYKGGSGPDVSVGDLVRVRGTVAEYNGLTEITSMLDLVICGVGPVPAPSAISLPVTDLEDFEPYEGMLVTFPQTLYISEYFNFDRFGEIVVTSERHLTPTAEFSPGTDANQAAQEFQLDKITLDDGRTSQNPDPAIHPNGNTFDLSNLFRGGDQLLDVTGVMDYAFGLYRIQPTQGATYVPANPRPAEPEAVGGETRVASFNVLNYFTTLDNAGPICGPLSNQDCRGADDATEFNRQRDKIISALAALDADIVGVIEIENHPTDAAMADLVSGLNAAVGAGTYDYIATGPIGTDAIKVGLLYKPATVSPSGAYAILDMSVDPTFLDTKNRPVLAQTFADNDGALLTVAVNHLKSKGSDCVDVGDPDTGDGQGNCNLTRTAAAQALAAWLAADPTGSGDSDALIIGDLNSYDYEDPISALLGAGYTDLVRQYQGEDAYTYVFDGQLGYLDHALSNPSLTGQVTGLATWHINADEPDLLDYDTTFKLPAQDALYEANAYRSSDHDPVLVGLSLDAPPTCGAAYPSADLLWPPNHKFAVVHILGLTDPEGGQVTIQVDSVYQDEPVAGGTGFQTVPDAFIVAKPLVALRVERDGDGNGRVYHISFSASDPAGNTCRGSFTVGVPHDQGSTPVDEGALYDSTRAP